MSDSGRAIGDPRPEYVDPRTGKPPYRAEDDPNNPRNSDGTFKDSGKYQSLRSIKQMRRRWRNR
jgi:hypothetical protein